MRRKVEPSFYGVYSEFGDVYADELPPTLDPWHGGYWQRLSLQKLENAIARPNTAPTDPYSHVALIVNQATKQGPCRVLDFGGGTGFVYFLVKPALRRPELVDWHVTDSSGLTRMGEQARRPDDRIRFAVQPEGFDVDRFEIVYLNTVLQYVDDWRACLERLLAPRPPVLIFTRLLAGAIPTFVARQVIGGTSTPCRFLNLDELLAFFGEYGYGADLIAPACDSLAGHYADDIPEDHRLERELTLVLSLF